MLIQCQEACREIWKDKAENNHEVTAEVQGNHPNFKQNLAEKEIFVLSNVKRRQHLFCKGCLREARIQKFTTRREVKKYEFLQHRVFPPSSVFPISVRRKLDFKTFREHLRSHGHSGDA